MTATTLSRRVTTAEHVLAHALRLATAPAGFDFATLDHLFPTLTTNEVAGHFGNVVKAGHVRRGRRRRWIIAR